MFGGMGARGGDAVAATTLVWQQAPSIAVDELLRVIAARGRWHC
jgi:hypothetical protein